MIDFTASWHRAWAHIALPAPTAVMEILVAAYDEPHRRYHTLQHLQECLALFDQVVDQAAHPGEVELALWFHDAIYGLQAKDNERRSADWAVEVLRGAGASDAVCLRVDRLIMATRHDAVPTDPDERLLVDIDLAILGASAERFAEYDRQVRDEYRWVPGPLYRIKRRQVLRSFLDRAAIYGTPWFQSRFEAQARRNLQEVAG